MFSTQPNYVSEEEMEHPDCEVLEYIIGHISYHKPFIIATITIDREGPMIGIQTQLLASLYLLEVAFKEHRGLKVNKLQLMQPMEDLLEGWKIHNISLVRRIKSPDEEHDEYITSEGVVLKFEKDTFNEFKGNEKQTHVTYKSGDVNIVF